MTGIDRTVVWPYVDGEVGDFYYARYAHPTGASAERELGALEGGDALLYASGMGAITTTLLALTGPGSRVALGAGIYFGTGKLLEELARWGVETVEFDQMEPPPPADLVLVEAPANPVLTLPDWQGLRAHPGLVVCDATVATPVYLRALDEGADVVVHSATKYLTGHHDALLGATITRDPKLTERLRTLRGLTGITASPDAAASLLRGLETLETRLRRQTETATELARRLERHPAVERVRYPGFSGLISFDVAGDPRPVEEATRLVANQTSLGGVRSSLESRHRWEGDRIPRGLVRLSVGLEDVDALWSDLDQALARASVERAAGPSA